MDLKEKVTVALKGAVADARIRLKTMMGYRDSWCRLSSGVCLHSIDRR